MRPKRERSTHDSDEDFGALAHRNFFPPTSSTGFSHDETPPEHSTIGVTPTQASFDGSEALSPTRPHA